MLSQWNIEPLRHSWDIEPLRYWDIEPMKVVSYVSVSGQFIDVVNRKSEAELKDLL